MKLSKTIAANFLSVIGAKLVFNVANFIVIAYLARVLGEIGFGKIGFAVAFISSFELIINPGLSTYGTNIVAREENKLSEIAGSIIAIKFCLASSCYIILSILLFFLPQEQNTKVLISIYGLGLFLLSPTLYWVFQGTQKMVWISIAQILNRISYIFLILLLVQDESDLISVSVAHVVSLLVAMGVLLIVYIKNYGIPTPKFQFAIWKQILKRSFPMGFSNIMIAIYLNLDLVILGFLRPMEEVGLYNSAVKIMVMISITYGLILQVFYPNFSKYFDNTEKLEKIIYYYHKLLMFYAIPIGFGGTLLARPIISFVYGESYVESQMAFIILIWAKVFVGLNMAYGNPLLAWNREKYYMTIVTIGAVVNLVGNFALIPWMGINGAAIATLAAELAVFLGMYREFQKIITSKLYNIIKKPMIASVVMSLSFIGLSLLNLQVVVTITLMGLLYGITMLLTKGITKQEIQLIFKP